MIELKIKVEGMRCGMCESHINEAVRKVSGVKKVTSSHSKNLTRIIGEDTLSLEEVIHRITSQGYRVIDVDSSVYEKRGFFSRFRKDR